jgi:hypothetical protein
MIDQFFYGILQRNPQADNLGEPIYPSFLEQFKAVNTVSMRMDFRVTRSFYKGRSRSGRHKLYAPHFVSPIMVTAHYVDDII